MWNSLPNDVVEADTTDLSNPICSDVRRIVLFNIGLDKIVLFNFNANLIGTGSLPICT